MSATLTTQLELAELTRRVRLLERQSERAFDRLVSAKVGCPDWDNRNRALTALDVELVALRARIAKLTADAGGVRHLQIAQ